MEGANLQPGKLVTLRGREWVVLPSEDADVLVVKPLGGSEDEVAGIYLPLSISTDKVEDAQFQPPSSADLGDISTARLLYDSARLAFRNGAGPFRCLAKLSFRPRAYQIVPLIMALRQEVVRILIADDVGVGKTVEALLTVRELLERRKIKRFAVVCLPHLCEQWQEEIRSKLDLEAVIVRSSTQARLDRNVHGDASVYDFYPYQIISIDYIKSDNRRNVFINECPELVIVDEAHTCAKPSGASTAQQQRYHLLRKLADKPEKNLILLTATPHSGKSEEFQSLLGLLRPDFEKLDLSSSTQSQRRELAQYFIQRKRADVEKWLDEDTPFPKRDAVEFQYDLSPKYAAFFEDIIDFARKLISADPTKSGKERVHYWTALALLRGVMSSPGAGKTMLNARLEKLSSFKSELEEQLLVENPVGDPGLGFDTDTAPTKLVSHQDWTEHQKRQLRAFAEQLDQIAGPKNDQKLFAAGIVLEDWIAQGINPVVFCRYIDTANYVGLQLQRMFKKKFPALDLQVVTSEDPDDVRKQRISDMSDHTPRILVATDCLSEGINLQELFSGVLHYDLPWNPNRLEQREGRVDRFGQNAPVVKACLLYGADNPIDGIVLDVLLRKVREIKRATGINVPFPEDSQSIIDTITQSLLLNPERHTSIKDAAQQQQLFDTMDFDEAAAAKARVTRKLDEAADREKISRSIFAQNAIKAQDIAQDLNAVDEVIGNPRDVEQFVVEVLSSLFGIQIIKDKYGFQIVTANLPYTLKSLLPHKELVKVSFQSPTPEGYYYIGRNNRLVEQLCQVVMANTISRTDKRAARAAVIRSKQVQIKTTLLLFRCRNVIEHGKAKNQIIAEEMLLWGYKGSPVKEDYVTHEEARELITAGRASSNLSLESRENFLANELSLLPNLEEQLAKLAEQQSKRLVESHERFSSLMDKDRFQVVYPVLPMDVMGIYVLLPEGN